MLRTTLLLSTLVILLCLAPASQADEYETSVIFAHGKNSASIQGDVLRGDRDVYLLRARAGQQMTVHLTALEDNAAFSIYAPQSKTAMTGTEEGSLTDWEGRLPANGTYRIAVGGTRGNASYTLQIRIE